MSDEELLSCWNLLLLLDKLEGGAFFQIFQEHGITEDHMKLLKSKHLDVLVPKHLFGRRILFEHNLQRWKMEQKLLESQTSPSSSTNEITSSDQMPLLESLKPSAIGKQAIKYYEDPKSRKKLATVLLKLLLKLSPYPGLWNILSKL